MYRLLAGLVIVLCGLPVTNSEKPISATISTTPSMTSALPTDSSVLSDRLLAPIFDELMALDVLAASQQIADLCRGLGLTHLRDYRQQCPGKIVRLLGGFVDDDGGEAAKRRRTIASAAVDKLVSNCQQQEQQQQQQQQNHGVTVEGETIYTANVKNGNCDLLRLEAAVAYEHYLEGSPSYPLGQRFTSKLPRYTTAELTEKRRKGESPPRTPFIIPSAFQRKDSELISCDSTMERLSKFETTRLSNAEYYEKGLKDFDQHISQQMQLPINDALGKLTLREGDANSAAYVHWYMFEEDWKKIRRELLEEIFAVIDDVFGSEQGWAEKCFPVTTEEDFGRRYEFFLNFRWWAMYAGNPGIGMFSHKDRHSTSSYQAQLCGNKRWRVCDPDGFLGDESMYATQRVQLDGKARTADLGSARNMSLGADLFDVDYEQRVLFRLARCYDDVTEPGDIIYYPANYWHQTMTMATKGEIIADGVNK